MADGPEVDEIRDTVITQIVDGGYVTAIPIIILSLYLFVQGYRRLVIITAIAGCAIGYLSASTLHPYMLDLGLNLTLDRFQLFSAMAFAMIAVMITSISIRFLATGFVFIIISNGIQMLKNYGINPEKGELLPGITAILAFFVGMSFRHVLPAFVAALLAAIGLFVGGCIVLDLPLSYLDLSQSNAPLACIPVAVISLFVQRWHKKRNSPDDGEVTVRQQQQAVQRARYHPELEVDTQWGARWIEKVNEGCSSLKYHLKQWMNALWEKNWVSFIHPYD